MSSKLWSVNEGQEAVGANKSEVAEAPLHVPLAPTDASFRNPHLLRKRSAFDGMALYQSEDSELTEAKPKPA